MRSGTNCVIEVAEPVPARWKQTNNCAELLAMRDQILLAIAALERDDKCFIFTDSDYTLQVTVGGIAEKHRAYGWASKPENEMIMRQIITFRELLPNLRVLPVMSHTDATDIATRWNSIADELATRGLSKASNSTAYAEFNDAICEIDLAGTKPVLVNSVRKAVAAFLDQRGDEPDVPAPTDD